MLLSTLHKPDTYNAARADISLASARRHAGDHTTAEELAIRALAVMVRLDSRHQQAHAHDVLVAIYEESGDNDLAERHRASASALRSTSPEAIGSRSEQRPDGGT
ncbi:tetratricopeptide repeat protein [Amycolatopsis acidiphila]|uniref:tetratricopeptide repeat protein n=2 Tax=Amycolatopsis acidiphila TaxID=715473 RepID=UPI0038994AC9